MIFREARKHVGVVFMRLHDERTPSKIEVLSRLLDQYEAQLAGSFVVVTETTVRFSRYRNNETS